MLMPGTNVGSIIFVIVVLIVSALIVKWLADMWLKYAKDVANAIGGKASIPSWVGPTIKTIIVIGVYVLVLTLGWNMMVNVTTSTNVKHINQSAAQEQKKVLESQLPTTEELGQARDEQKDRQQTKPHVKALNTFDEKMKAEAEKIKRRSLNK